MKNHIKNSAKILYDYAMALIVFAIFVYVFMSITKDNFGRWLPLYSFLIFLLMFLILYSEMKGLAIKEKRPQYELNPYPLKGLVYGLTGSVPIFVLTGVAALIHTGNIYSDRIIHLAINTVLGPVYFVIKALNESLAGYAAGILLIPLITMTGYLAGYYGINILDKLKKKKVVEEKGFKKSPWNPSNAPVKKNKKKNAAK